MARALYLIQAYPQISETYMHTEIDRVQRRHEVVVATLFQPDIFYAKHAPFLRLKDQDVNTYAALARQVKPDIVHGHYLHLAPALRFLAREAGTFFTIRSHSFDVLGGKTLADPNVIDALNDPLCRGVLCFPFARDIIRRAGVDAKKVYPCWPVADIGRFRNRAPNGDGVMNVGAALVKKNMNEFADLAKIFPAFPFDLYMMGYDASSVVRYAQETGSPVRIMPLVQPEDMPAEYKKHGWMVYTASKTMNTVGWPLSVAEAQASGVGVLLQNIRPDIREFVGPGGFVFDTVEDAARIISQPFPDEMREISFAHAEKSNVDNQIGLLFDLWN